MNGNMLCANVRAYILYIYVCVYIYMYINIYIYITFLLILILDCTLFGGLIRKPS